MEKRVSRKISSYLKHFLTVLSKPQRVSFPIYMVGILWMIKFRSIREIALTYGGQNIDRLHHFLTGSMRKVVRLQETLQQEVVRQVREGAALLILDDTSCPREGKHIEGIGIHHSGNGFIKGLCAVTAIIKVGTRRFCWAIRGYRPKSSCAEGEFRSKVQLAIEILQEAARDFGQGTLTVLMDSWYTCAPILNPIREAGWTFVAAIKQNRLVRVDGKKRSVRRLAKGLRFKTVRLSKKKRFRIAKRQVDLPKVGTVLLFISKDKDSVRYFVSNNLSLTERDMARLYAQRWGIETFHREIKQFLGFGELFMRSWTGVQTHWTLVGIGYNMIVLWNGTRSHGFRHMLRNFRESVSHENIIRLPKRLRLAS